MPSGALDRKVLGSLALWLRVPSSPHSACRRDAAPATRRLTQGAPLPTPSSHPATQTITPGSGAAPGQRAARGVSTKVGWGCGGLREGERGALADGARQRTGCGQVQPLAKEGLWVPYFPSSPLWKALPSRAPPTSQPSHGSHVQGWAPGAGLQGPRPKAGLAPPLFRPAAGLGPGARKESSLLFCHRS